MIFLDPYFAQFSFAEIRIAVTFKVLVFAVHTGPAAHPASCTRGTVSLSGE
jgi:hypothetical protein